MGQMIEGVIDLLRSEGAQVKVSIHVEGSKAAGFSGKAKTALEENVRTLKATGRFEKD